MGKNQQNIEFNIPCHFIFLCNFSLFLDSIRDRKIVFLPQCQSLLTSKITTYIHTRRFKLTQSICNLRTAPSRRQLHPLRFLTTSRPFPNGFCLLCFGQWVPVYSQLAYPLTAPQHQRNHQIPTPCAHQIMLTLHLIDKASPNRFPFIPCMLMTAHTIFTQFRPPVFIK